MCSMSWLASIPSGVRMAVMQVDMMSWLTGQNSNPMAATPARQTSATCT